MESYNSQPILRKKWNIKDKKSFVQIRKIVRKSNKSKEVFVFYFANLITTKDGKKTAFFLGESDNLGRPLLAKNLKAERA